MQYKTEIYSSQAGMAAAMDRNIREGWAIFGMWPNPSTANSCVVTYVRP